MEESVSLGKFTGDDTLCWEKWSSFSQNKYMVEAEKCSTPGSVAKKRAYFEAHYKKIAAQTAELLEKEQQQQLIQPNALLFNDHPIHVAATDDDDDDDGSCGEFTIVHASTEPLDPGPVDAESNGDGGGDDDYNESADYGNNLSDDDVNEAAVKEMAQGSDDRKESIELNKSNEAPISQQVQEIEVDVLVDTLKSISSSSKLDDESFKQSEIKQTDCELDTDKSNGSEIKHDVQDKKELKERDLSKEVSSSRPTGQAKAYNKKNATSKQMKQPVKEPKKDKPMSVERKSARTISKPVETISKPRNLVTSRMNVAKTISKPVASVPKQPLPPVTSRETTTRKFQKPTIPQSRSPNLKNSRTSPKPGSPKTAVLRNSTRKDRTSAVTKSSSALERRLNPPPPLSMSSDSAPTIARRRSLIMEQMGDKEIVKRAFKAFRNSLDLSRYSITAEKESSNSHKIIPMNGVERSCTPTSTIKKDKDRVRNVPKSTNQRQQTGVNQRSISSRSQKPAASWK